MPYRPEVPKSFLDPGNPTPWAMGRVPGGAWDPTRMLGRWGTSPGMKDFGIRCWLKTLRAYRFGTLMPVPISTAPL